ncbi:E3 ubiquitin-protein ligase RNF8 [Drosophila biarmipes]|uniref:E3 ubiquitin-protein ligase RNF8 n=1 Tax=Drosophila biarmipes TaxID=125945 RepID=UPI0007E8287C|nr:E3 ubiquitin-protein ligase RNF8 [Drosophila biarmipes]
MSSQTKQQKIMIKIDDLLGQLQKQEQDLEKVYFEEPFRDLNQRLAQLELHKAQISLYHRLREDILLDLEEKVTKYDSSLTELERIAEMRGQVNEINRDLDRMYEIQNCSLCEATCDPQGNHCLVSLRCGHLFGQHCIYSALRRAFQCPMCLRPALYSDIRKIYGLNLFPF